MPRLKKFPDPSDLLPSRKEAAAKGEKFYCTGKPCPHGHASIRRTADGSCVDCMRVHRTNDYYRSKQKEALDVTRAEERKRRERVSKRRWQENNKDKRRAKQAAYAAKNKEKLATFRRAWFAAHPELRKQYKATRRARELGAEGVFSAQDVARIEEAQKQRCACCRQKLKHGQVDHIIALSKGGTNWPNNLQLLCLPCNSSKKARDPIEFMQSRGRLL